MEAFNIYVLRNAENHFPYFVSLVEDACHTHARISGFTLVEVVGGFAVSREFMDEVTSTMRIQNTLLDESKNVIDNGVKDLADAGRALARMQRERDQLEAKIEGLNDEVLTLQAENAALKVQVRNAQLQGGGL